MENLYPRTSPWHYVVKSGGGLLTPEDIQAAINADGTKLEIWNVVLDAISKDSCEDAACCAFVARRFEKTKEDINT
jgi:hypothetical protein